ncbi:MAG: alginate export family protein [Steroidobacteraceae bacterium]|nr:alginate export family protein [Steroidobacteraceae bacterium]
MRRYVLVGVILFSSLLPGTADAADPEGPWRIGEALALPDPWSFGGSYRTRYETLDGGFRARSSGSDELLVGRLLVNARFTGSRFYAGVELEDSRQRLADSGTPLGTDVVNTLEPLQGYVGMRFGDARSNGGGLDVAAGRMTIDAGSRRLVARNSFRNTINAFTGVHATWKGSAGSQIQAFYVLPLQRKPSNFESLLGNDSAPDTESGHVRFWGILAAKPGFFPGVAGEVYLYGLRSRDQAGIPVADRDIYTPGVRLYRKPATQAWDFEVEGAVQLGTSRFSTAAADTRQLQHRAGFFHGEIGFTLSARMSPRVELSYDFASGDKDPADNRNNRFDTLYGARRFDFGPTGLYGAFARGNISTPGVRLEAKPGSVSGMLGYRAVWLASSRDQYTTGRLVDPTGESGSFLGHQIEAQVQYNVLPGNVAIEVGGAHLFHGSFLEQVPNGPAAGDTTYVYAAATVTF